MDTVPAIGTKVSFRPGFSDPLSGLVFTVDSTDNGIDLSNGKQMVGVKIKLDGRTTYRLAYLSDLIPAMTDSAAAEAARLGLVQPEPCLMCGGLFELSTLTEIKRPRARKIDGYACEKCTPECLTIAAR
jgi:hypothetical protein